MKIFLPDEAFFFVIAVAIANKRSMVEKDHLAVL